jgi:predicted aldo/keto reductase-like oxidoreductase
MSDTDGTTGAQGKARGTPGWTVAAAWIATVVLCFSSLGWWLGSALEGMDRALLSSLPLVLAGAAVLASVVLTFRWAFRLFANEDGVPRQGAGRRRFLTGAAVSVGGVVAGVAATVGRNLDWLTVTSAALSTDTPRQDDAPRAAWEGAHIQSYRRLGRTNFEVSDISLGSGRIKGELGERVARAAIERGINYFDTAPDYSEAGSELALGKVMQGNRDKMFLATKFCRPGGNLPTGTPVADYIAAVDGSLQRLQTDYVDLVHIHSCDTVERLMDPNAHEAFDRLKEQGKVRFLGFSSHTPNLEQVAETAIESNRFDVMMLAYHHGAWPKLGELIDRAHAIDMGVVAMKTLKGAHHKGLMESREEQDSYTQAAFKWVLSNPKVACLVVSFSELAHVDEYIYASGKLPAQNDYASLQRYDELIAGKHCYQHCGACLSSCPEGLPIDDVLRFRMYFEDYGDEREAMRQYDKLQVKADVCTGCNAPCANACPFDVPIAEATQGAHRMLTLGA